MVGIIEPVTSVSKARYDLPLEDAVKKFSQPLEKTRSVLGNSHQYALFNETGDFYLFMVSQQIDRKLDQFGGNVLLTVTSYRQVLNEMLKQKFERETGIRFDIALPEEFNRKYDILNQSFKVFEKNPKAAMRILKG